MGKALMSNWSGLEDRLLATFALAGGPKDKDVIRAPLTEYSGPQFVLNWQSPFENTGIEASASNSANLLQTGAASDILKQLASQISNEALQAIGRQIGIDASVEQFRGRTGITKLNSTQAFAGMQPLKMTMKALFRAVSDPVAEVHDPINALINMSLPIVLENTSTVVTRALQHGATLPSVLMPSLAPALIEFSYKGLKYSPMVIEAIEVSDPPLAQNGWASAQVSMTLCSLTALDRADWKAMLKPE